MWWTGDVVNTVLPRLEWGLPNICFTQGSGENISSDKH